MGVVVATNQALSLMNMFRGLEHARVHYTSFCNNLGGPVVTSFCAAASGGICAWAPSVWFEFGIHGLGHLKTVDGTW